MSNTNLIWIDLEMTGLDPKIHKIIEIATIITDINLEIIATGPVIAIHQPKEELDKMDKWCVKTHKKTGLTQRVIDSKITINLAKEQTIEFLKKHVTKNTSPMCGNSICQDRRFLYEYMPELENFFHYRNLDVSTLKELANLWRPELKKQFKKKCSHIALDDIKESIDELKFYQQNFLNLTTANKPK